MLQALKNLMTNNDADKQFFDTLKISEYTPDRLRLDQFATQFILNYSPGFLQNIPEDQFTVYGNAFTDDDTFLMWKKILGDASFPVPMKFTQSMPRTSPMLKITVKRDGQTNLLYPPGRIGGQLCLLKNPAHWLTELDNKVFNGLYFTRQRIKVLVYYHEYEGQISRSGPNHTGWVEKVAYVNAWIYLGEPEYWKEQIEKSEDGRRQALIAPLHVFHAKNKLIGDYYHFTELEYNCPYPIDWKDSTFVFGQESTLSQRRKRLANLNKDLIVKDVKPNRIKATLSKLHK